MFPWCIKITHSTIQVDCLPASFKNLSLFFAVVFGCNPFNKPIKQYVAVL